MNTPTPAKGPTTRSDPELKVTHLPYPTLPFPMGQDRTGRNIKAKRERRCRIYCVDPRRYSRISLYNQHQEYHKRACVNPMTFIRSFIVCSCKLQVVSSTNQTRPPTHPSNYPTNQTTSQAQCITLHPLITKSNPELLQSKGKARLIPKDHHECRSRTYECNAGHVYSTVDPNTTKHAEFPYYSMVSPVTVCCTSK